jgi:cleavage and polyadenylation specificity factor subunit 5
MQSTVTLFPLTNYSFGTKDPATSDPTLEPSAFERLKKLQEDYSSLGMRQTLEALLLVHDHGHPHILMLQTGSNYFKL